MQNLSPNEVMLAGDSGAVTGKETWFSGLEWEVLFKLFPLQRKFTHCPHLCNASGVLLPNLLFVWGWFQVIKTFKNSDWIGKHVTTNQYRTLPFWCFLSQSRSPLSSNRTINSSCDEENEERNPRTLGCSSCGKDFTFYVIFAFSLYVFIPTTI